MPLSVTCECGAKLEIDEKFLGKEILCPDCQRPLPTNAPATPPPLELPDYRRVSGYAVFSLTLALVGAFTIVGTIAAIVVGIYALKHISDKPSKLEGINFARAGIAVGAFFTIFTLAAMISPFVFGIDGFLREMALAGRIQYPAGSTFEVNDANRLNLVFTRPSNQWASYISPNVMPEALTPDDLIMVNVAEDAFIACLTCTPNEGGIDNDEDRQKEVLKRFYKSELVNLLGRLNGRPLDGEGVVVGTPKVERGKNTELILDLRLGGIDRRFLIQYPSDERNELTVLIGAARRNRFDRLNDVFHKTFESKKLKKE